MYIPATIVFHKAIMQKGFGVVICVNHLRMVIGSPSFVHNTSPLGLEWMGF